MMWRQGSVMKVSELRGLLLEKYYQRRKERLIGLVPSDFDGKLNEQDILNIAGQLADHGLIHWRANMGHGGIGGGMGTITAAGVDVVEGKVAAPIEIHLSPDRSLQVSASSGATPANETKQTVAVAIERLAQAIDDSDASAAHKRAARLLLRAFQEHPLLCTIAQGHVGQSNDGQPKPESETANETRDESH
ncbi:MAG: hypothetical protein ACLQFF_01850 [Steroidobacteraceae bacterium]